MTYFLIAVGVLFVAALAWFVRFLLLPEHELAALVLENIRSRETPPGDQPSPRLLFPGDVGRQCSPD